MFNNVESKTAGGKSGRNNLKHLQLVIKNFGSENESQ
jgi:hypothetical protein